MRKIRYQVATSLDGYIAGLKGEFDWIVHEDAIDFNAIFAQFDTIIMGRGTFEIFNDINDFINTFQNKDVYIISTTLEQINLPNVHVISENVIAKVNELRLKEGKDIWLYGGGKLFSQLLAEKLVDTVELAYIPVLLGEGIPLLSPLPIKTQLKLNKHTVYPSGIILAEYDVLK